MADLAGDDDFDGGLFIYQEGDPAGDDDFDGEVFIYRGGRAPRHITHTRIDESIDNIVDAFNGCKYLVHVKTHNGIRRIGRRAFAYCKSLPRINLKSVEVIDDHAFVECHNLADIEFGDWLETIGHYAFYECIFRRLKLPSIVTIETGGFNCCTELIDVELSERLETVEENAFEGCECLQRVAIHSPGKEIHKLTILFLE